MSAIPQSGCKQSIRCIKQINEQSGGIGVERAEALVPDPGFCALHSRERWESEYWPSRVILLLNRSNSLRLPFEHMCAMREDEEFRRK